MPLVLVNPEPRISAATPVRAAGPTRATDRGLDAPTLLRLWHLASLDAPTVAVVWSLAFAWAANILLPLWTPVLLGLVAWAVYIGDRLLDARSALRTAHLHRLRLRHRFHWRHRRVFIPLAIAAACAATGIVFLFMPAPARERNSVLACAALAYFTRVHSGGKRPRFKSSFLPKELLVGVLFAAGCTLPALSRAALQHGSPLWPIFAATLFFAALAWLNCHSIERWETEAAHPTAEKPALLLAFAGMLLASILAPTHPRPAALLAAGAASALLLALLDFLRPRLTPLALRAAADLVLLTPACLALRAAIPQ